LLGIIISAGLIFWAVRKRNSALTFFSIAWFFIALLPMSNIYPINAYMAEHWLYLPAIGLFWLFASGVNRLYKKKAFAIAAVSAAALITAFFSFLTVKQNATWKKCQDCAGHRQGQQTEPRNGFFFFRGKFNISQRGIAA
jgi:hypothetical protein